jgi:hypothetical protein
MITKKMYECTQDAQEGVVTFVLEECAQQRIKENLLAYALLLRAGARPLRLGSLWFPGGAHPGSEKKLAEAVWTAAACAAVYCMQC